MNGSLQSLLVTLIVALCTAQALRMLLPRAWRLAAYQALARHWPAASSSWRWAMRLDEASCSNCDACGPAPTTGQTGRRVIPIRNARR